MKFTPIVIFAYNRQWHIRQTVEALQKNELANQSDLIIYSDGPKDLPDQSKVDAVRQYIHSIRGFRSITIVESFKNQGLGDSIIAGVTETVDKYDRVIVLEDDLVTSPFFLRYMNDALDLYENEEKVISIHGYIYPISEILPTTFFLRSADCLGWATWKRGWNLFEEDGQRLLHELYKNNLTKLFDFNGAYRYTRMLKDQIAGRNTSWAVRWYASAFLNDRLTLYPGVSLVQHIGNDGTGTNFGALDFLDVELAKEPLSVTAIELAENPEARRIVADYLRSIKTQFVKAVINRGKKYLRRLLRGECGE